MAKMMYREAVRNTIFQEMKRDDSVVVLGEDVVGGMGTDGGPEAIGGIWSTSTGLWSNGHAAPACTAAPTTQSACGSDARI